MARSLPKVALGFAFVVLAANNPVYAMCLLACCLARWENS